MLVSSCGSPSQGMSLSILVVLSCRDLHGPLEVHLQFHISASRLFRFLDLLDGYPPGSKVCRVFIKGYISTDVDLLESWEVYSVGLLCITVSYEYTLLPRRIELGPFLLWDMYVNQETKYYEMADF